MASIRAQFMNAPIRQKMLMLVFIILALLVLVAGISVYKLNRIGDEIAEISNESFPATKYAMELTIHQLEETIAFNRLIAAMQQSERDLAHEQELLDELHHQADLVAELFPKLKDIQHLITEHATTPERLAEAQAMEGSIETVEQHIAELEHHSEELLTALAGGDTRALAEQGPLIEEEEHAVIKELEELILSMEHATQNAIDRAYADEQRALVLILVVSVISLALGIFLAVFISGIVTKPLSRAVETMQALADGDTSVTLDVSSKDEVGTLAGVIEVFRQRTIEANRLEER